MLKYSGYVTPSATRAIFGVSSIPNHTMNSGIRPTQGIARNMPIEETPKIALVALGVTYPLYFNIYGGIRSADAQLVEAARMMGLGRLGLIRYVILPSALPGALVGLRYALSTAWLALVFAEQINADAGLGYLMSNAQQYFRTDIIVLCLAVYALLGLACDFAVRILSRRLLTWRANFEGEA